MASNAAVLSVLVQAKGIQKVTRDLRDVDDGLRKTAGQAGKAAKDIEDTGKRGSRSLGGLKKAAGLLGGVAVGAGLAKGMKLATDEFEEARKVGALTTNVIKSTGGAANITAKQVGALSTSISKKVGIDDEAIQSGANLLLTFKNIRNETGKGRDIFNQTTQAAVDLSAAGFGSLESTSKQLGKALNDPVKGMSALGRSGVTFSEDQKKVIKALMDTGKASDRVKAQQLILKEVNSQVGGAAAAQATSMDKLKVTLGNLAEAAGAVLVPMLDKAARFLTKLIGGMLESKGAGGAVISVFKGVGGVLTTVGGVIAGVVRWFIEHKTVTLALAAAAGVLLAAFVGFQVVAGVVALIRGMVTVFWLLNAAMAANPIGLVVIALAALVAALVIAYRESDTFRAIVTAAFDAIKAVVGAVIPIVVAIVKTGWEIIKALTVNQWNAVKTTIATVWSAISSAVSTAANAVKTVVTGAWNAISSASSAVWNAIKSAVTGVWSAISSAASATWGGIRDAILTPIRAARDLLDGVWSSVKNRASDAWDSIKSAASRFANGLGDTIGAAFKGVANTVIGFVNKIIDAINIIPGVDIGNVQRLATGGVLGDSAAGAVQGLYRGGVVNQPMAIVGEEAPRHPEFVIPTNPAYRDRAIGLTQSLMAQLGMGGVPGFAKGGILGALAGGGKALWDLASGGLGMITDRLPGLGALPDWIKGAGSFVLKRVGGWIKDQIGSLFDKGGGLAGVMKAATSRPPIGTPYVYGGGHGGSIAGGVDCSGGVSWALMGGNLIGGPMTTDGLKVYGEAGDGKAITIGVRGSTGRQAHTMMQIAGKYFESGSGHGWSEVGGWAGNFPIHRHPPGLAMGGIVQDALAQVLDPDVVGFGLRRGGVLGSFENGTDYVPRTGPYNLHKGESVTPAGQSEALIASQDRLSDRLDALLRSGVSVVTLTDHVGSVLGDQAVRRGQTAGDPSRTAIVS